MVKTVMASAAPQALMLVMVVVLVVVVAMLILAAVVVEEDKFWVPVVMEVWEAVVEVAAAEAMAAGWAARAVALVASVVSLYAIGQLPPWE